MFISEVEANSIIQAVCYGFETFRAQELKSKEIEALETSISTKKAESLKRGVELRLHALSELFSLTPFETDILLITLAPELDARFAKLYAYLQNDLTKKQPTVEMLIELLCTGLEEKLASDGYLTVSKKR